MISSCTAAVVRTQAVVYALVTTGICKYSCCEKLRISGLPQRTNYVIDNTLSLDKEEQPERLAKQLQRC